MSSLLQLTALLKRRRFSFSQLQFEYKKGKRNGEGCMRMSGDRRESAGLACTEYVVEAAPLGEHEKYWEILNAFFKKWMYCMKYTAEV